MTDGLPCPACGLPMVGEVCAGCAKTPGSCECGPAEPLGAKKAKEAKEVGPDVPVAAPEIYTGILGDITMAAEPGTEADPVGILGSLLTMTSVAVGTAPHVQVGNDRHPLLIWTLLFGRTGSGRKGGATQTAELFAAPRARTSPSYATSGLSSGEGLIERIRDGDGKDDRRRRTSGCSPSRPSSAP